MSFSKAKVERFNEIKGCAPPLGSYDPKFPSVAGTGGPTLYKLPRSFSKDTTNCSQNAPLTPASAFDTPKGPGYYSCNRPGPSKSVPRRLPGAFLSGRSISTYSLPSNITADLQEHSDDETEFEVRKNMNDEYARAHDAELADMKDELKKSKAEHAKLVKQIEILRSNLSDAEAKIVNLDQVAGDVEHYETQLREQKKDLAEILSSQEVLKLEATNAKQQQEELKQKYDEAVSQVQKTVMEINLMSTTSEKEHQDNLELRGKLEEHELSSRIKFVELQTQIDIQLKVNSELEIQLQQNAVRFNEISVSIESWKKEAEDAKRENRELKSSVGEKSSRCAALESSLKESQEKAASLSSTDSELKKCEVALKESQSTLSILTHSLQQKESELNEALAVSEDYKAQSEMQRSKVDEILRSVNHLQLQIKILEELNSHKDQDLSDAQQSLQVERSQIMSLQNDLELREAELAKSETSLLTCSNDLKEERCSSEKAVKALEGVQAEIQILNANHMTRVEELESMIASQNAAIELNKKELAEQLANIQNLNSQLFEKCKELEECQNALNATSCDVQQLELDLSDKFLELKEVKAAVDEFKLECTKAHNVVGELERALTNETVRATNLEQQIKHKDDQLKEGLESVSREQDKLLVMTSKLELKEAELAESSLALQSTCDSLNQETSLKETLMEQLKEAEDKIQHKMFEQEENTKLVNSLQLQISESTTQIQNQKEQINLELAKSQELNGQLASKCEELSVCQNELNAVTYQIDELKLLLVTKDLEINSLKDNANDWKMQTEMERKENQELQQIVADQESAITSLKKSLAEKEKELSTTFCKLDEEKAHVEILTARIEVTETELAEVEKSLEESKDSLTKEVHLREKLVNDFEVTETKLRANIAEKDAQQTEYLKRFAEYELNTTSQSINIAELKNELDEVQCTANQLKSHLNERTDQLDKARRDLEKNSADLEEERTRFTAIQMQLTSDIEARNRELKSASEKIKLWQSRYEEMTDEREKHIQRLKTAEAKLSEYLELQLKDASASASRTAELQKSETEIRVLKHFFTRADKSAAKSKEKLASIEAEMSSHRTASDTWKALYIKTALDQEEHTHICTRDRQQSMEKLEHSEAQIALLKVQNDELKNLIGPFEDQLNLYKANLDAEKDAADIYRDKTSALLDKEARRMGHQNPKQKIHHLQKLKEDNQDLLNKNVALQKELKVKSKLVLDLQAKVAKQPRRMDPSQAFQHRHYNHDIDAESRENLPG